MVHLNSFKKHLKFITRYIPSIYEICRDWQPAYPIRFQNQCALKCLNCKVQFPESAPTFSPIPFFDDLPTHSTNIMAQSAQKIIQALKPIASESLSPDLQRLYQEYIAGWISIDIVGGEPFLHPDLEYLVALLKSQQRYIRVWTTGHFDLDLFIKIAPLIDELIVYVPTIDPAQYIEFTGTDGLQDVWEAIDVFREYKKKVTVHTPVQLDTIQDLPYIYDVVYAKKLNWLIHYETKTNFSAESIQNLKRFQRIRNCSVQATDAYQSMGCSNYPMNPIFNLS